MKSKKQILRMVSKPPHRSVLLPSTPKFKSVGRTFNLISTQPDSGYRDMCQPNGLKGVDHDLAFGRIKVSDNYLGSCFFYFHSFTFERPRKGGVMSVCEIKDYCEECEYELHEHEEQHCSDCCDRIQTKENKTSDEPLK